MDVRDDGNKIGVMWKTDGDWTFSPDHGSPVGVGTKLADAKACVIEEMESLEDGGEEAETVGSVVKRKYHDLYKERGNPRHCGDWLAEEMDGVFVGDGGVFDLERFNEALKMNGVELLPKTAALPTSGQKGWQGRYRMNARQRLEQVVVKTGKLFLPGDEKHIEPDMNWLTEKAAFYSKRISELNWTIDADGNIKYN